MHFENEFELSWWCCAMRACRRMCRPSPTAAVVGGTLIEPLVPALAAAWLWDQALTARQGEGALLLKAAMLLLAWRRAAGA